MTKENRERQYLHFRDLEANFVQAVPHLNAGVTSTSNVRKRAKLNADKMLAARPELAKLLELKEEPKEEKKPEPKKEELKPSSKKKEAK